MIIPNKISITYRAIMPNCKTISDKTESNAVNTQILSYSVTKTIGSDKTILREGENVQITVTVSNNSNTKIFNNFFTVPIPDGATYVSGSLEINGVSQPTYEPLSGFAIPDLNPNESLVIRYKLKANEPIAHFATLRYTVNDPVRGIVNYSENTDSVLLNVISDKINIVKTVDKAFAVIGEKLHYTVTVTNNGNISKSDLLFKDTISDGTSFVSNSVKIDGKVYSAYNPQTGFTLRNLAPNEVIVIEFDLKLNKMRTITNTATVTDNSGNSSITLYSNPVQTLIRTDNYIVKRVNYNLNYCLRCQNCCECCNCCDCCF